MTTHRQRGVALIMALLVVAIAGILAVELVWQTNLDLQRTEGLMSWDQAKQLGYAAEDEAAVLIQQAFDETNSQKYTADNEGKYCGDDGSDQGGGGLAFPLDLTEDAKAQGTVIVYLCDLQSRFNLNNLVNPSTGKKDPLPVQQFKRLLRILVEDYKLENIDVDMIADSAVDWIDPDSNEEPDGAEDSYYTGLPVPYQAANTWFSSPSELLAVKGMTQEMYAVLRFYVTALPVPISASASHTKINVNTARGPVLRSLGDNITAENAARWISQRPGTPFENPATDFTGLVDAGMLPYLDVKTDFFGLQSIITIGTTQLQMYSLLERTGAAGAAGGGFRVRQRCFDCVENQLWPNPQVVGLKDDKPTMGDQKVTMGDE